MKNANWTRILTILLVLLASYTLIAVAWSIIARFTGPILLVILAAILAYVLTPIVDRLQMASRSRALAILTTYLLLGTVLAGLGLLLTQPLVVETQALINAMKSPTPAQLESLTAVRATTHRVQSLAQTLEASVRAGSGCAAARVALPSNPACTPTSSPSLPVELTRLQNTLLPALTLPGAVRAPAPATHSKRLARQAPVPHTQVPPSYLKPVERAVRPLATALASAQTALTRDLAHHTHLTRAQRSALLPRAKNVYQLASQLRSQADKLYNLVRSTPVIELTIQTEFDHHHIPVNLHNVFGEATSRISSQSTVVLNNALAILTGTINVLVDVVIVVVMSFYLLADGGRFIRWLFSLVPDRNREKVWFFVQSLDRVLGGYIRGQLVVAITVGILAGVGSQLLGIPYALLIGIFAFLTETIPVIGPVLASIPAGLISLFTEPAIKTVMVAGWFFIIQQLESNVIGPRITGHAVGIHPLVAMIAVLAGFDIFGFWGAFLAVPITGLLQVFAREAYSYFILQRPLPTAEVPGHIDIDVEPLDRERPPPPAAE